MVKASPNKGEQKLPFVKKDQVILSEGVWKQNSYSMEEIRNAFLNTDWEDTERRHLYNDHLDVDPKDGAHIPTPVSSWVGFIQNPRFTEKGLVGDVEVWNPTIAFYLEKAKPKFGISATMVGREDEVTGDYKSFMFNSFGLVVNPGCKDAYMKLSDSEDPSVKKIRMITLSDEQESDLTITERGSNLVKNIMAKELETTETVENTESNEVKEEAKPEAETTEKSTEETTEEKSDAEEEEEEKVEEAKEEVTEEKPKEPTTEDKTKEVTEEPKAEDKKTEEKKEENEKPTETKRLSEKRISELTVKELSDYSNFAIKYLSDNPETPMSDVADAFEASSDVKKETLADMSMNEMFKQMKSMMESMEARMKGKTLSDETPETEKVEEKTEETEKPAEESKDKEAEKPEEKKELSDGQDLKIKKLSDEIDLLQKKLSEPSTRKTLSETSGHGVTIEHTHEDAFTGMAGFIHSGGQGSFTF